MVIYAKYWGGGYYLSKQKRPFSYKSILFMDALLHFFAYKFGNTKINPYFCTRICTSFCV